MREVFNEAILDVQNGKLLMSGKVIVDTYIILHIIILISFLVLRARFFTKELEFLMNFIRFNLSSLFLMFLTFNVILYLDLFSSVFIRTCIDSNSTTETVIL